MKSVMDKTAIIQSLFNIHNGVIPRIYHDTFENLDTASPGMDGTAIKLALDNLAVLKKGRFLVLSGPVGCGKSFASHVTALMFEWAARVEKIYEESLDNLQKGNDWEFIRYDFLEGSDEYRSWALTFKIYNERFQDPAFIFRTAPDILKDALRTDSRILARKKLLLIIDDLGRDYFTDRGWGISEWYSLFNIRYSGRLPTLITTNLTPEEFVDKYNEPIYDRLKEIATWVTINEKSLRQEATNGPEKDDG